jgi:outer membrane receptor for ferrienterochelin and colicin
LGSTYGAYDQLDRGAPSISYFDLSVAWHPWKFLELRAGCDNLFDRDPPILTNPSLQGAGYANTFATYDVLGRQIYAAFTVNLVP